MSALRIRPASIAKSDNELLVDFQESQIAWLSSIGSGDQWGRESIRETRPDAPEKTLAWIRKSEAGHPWGPDWCRAWIAEVDTAKAEDTTPTMLPVAALVLEAKSAAYVRSVLPEQDQRDPFVYVDYLLSNRHAGEQRKGAGAALIALAKDEARKLGIGRLCLDCWRGNDRKLVKYYESQGFRLVGDFTAEQKDWPGSVMEMRIEAQE